MKVTADLDRCIGAGKCVLAAEHVFDQREDDGIVVVLVEHPTDSDLVDARYAARQCPASAITVE